MPSVRTDSQPISTEASVPAASATRIAIGQGQPRLMAVLLVPRMASV
ncbi:MAG: hypothetical protein K0S57_4517 [Ramlibacter sp.]|nr:hypothetical protein [Ramlibacter sp.]